MNQIAIYFYMALSVFLGILAVFFGFKAKQANGAWRVNDIETRHGRGSFAAGIKATTMTIVWGVLCVAAVGGVGGALSYIKGIESQAAAEKVANPLPPSSQVQGRKP